MESISCGQLASPTVEDESGSGVPIRLYIDHAKIYRSPQLARIAASLGTLIVHSRPYQPEGRGKIEPCFRTVREQFLAKVDPKHPLSLDELNDRLRVWIESVYHRSEHSALGTTPLLRWQRDIEQVRQLPPKHRLGATAGAAEDQRRKRRSGWQ